MTDYILKSDKYEIIFTYNKGGKLKKAIAKKGFLIDAGLTGICFEESDLDLEKWKKNEPEPDHFFDMAKSWWFSFYKLKAGVDYRFMAKDGKALKDIGVHLTKISGSTAKALDIWQHVLYDWGRLDPFYRNKMELTFINSQLNTILNLLKNGKQTGNTAASNNADAYRQNF